MGKQYDKQKERWQKRRERIAANFLAGWTETRIANAFGVKRQRIHSILKRMGIK